MPSRKTHIIGGVIFSIPIVGGIYYYFASNFNYFLLSGILAASLVLVLFGSLLPDILERPSNPEHRKFFHSWFMLSFIFITAFIACFVIIPRFDHVFIIYPIFGFLLGYISHLLLDSTTKSSLT
ncbi:MAG: metal-dependent hydrolase [Candidatus Heimdallarchaeota archaeon]|nr:metal-dependent hydrolase [Candidatus Heimdallarchaeota archaeon]MCK4955651.1 metal-dependent hydrolase [Candidatus Heimdallarchaeota archaeon]